MVLKLGKLPPVIDKRTIKLKSILKTLPPPPLEYDIEKQIQLQVPYRMFMNDTLGDCVVVSKVNFMLRAEVLEQNKVVSVSDQDVMNQYFKESGGQDCGLVMLYSLNDWRNNGLKLGGRKLACLQWGGENYKIHAFASIDPDDAEDIKYAVQYLNGPAIGLRIYQSTYDQYNAGKTWDYVPEDKDLVGGHAVYVVAYNEIGPQYLTWGTKVQATWKFHEMNCDEGYALVDAKDEGLDTSPIDEEKLETYLNEIAG